MIHADTILLDDGVSLSDIMTAQNGSIIQNSGSAYPGLDEDIQAWIYKDVLAGAAIPTAVGPTDPCTTP